MKSKLVCLFVGRAVHPCLSWKPVSRIGDDYEWQEGIVPGNLTHRSPASAPHCAQPCAPHNRGQRGRHTEGRSTIQGTQPSNPNSSDVEGKPPVKNIATGETSPAITPYHTYHFSISTSLTFITNKLPSKDDFHHLITFTTG